MSNTQDLIQQANNRMVDAIPENKKLKECIKYLEAKVAELEKIKDGLHDRVFSVLSILGIYPDFGDIVCNGCDGIGKKVYANTSTYLKGIGGQAMTEDVCDECWGSGKSNAPFKNLRKLHEQARQLKGQEHE